MPWKKGNPGCPCCEDACRIPIEGWQQTTCDTYAWSWDGDWGGWAQSRITGSGPPFAYLSTFSPRTGTHHVSLGYAKVTKTFTICTGGGTLTVYHRNREGEIRVNGSRVHVCSRALTWTKYTYSLSAGTNTIELWGDYDDEETWFDDIEITNVASDDAWDVSGSTLTTDASDVLAITTNEHPEDKSTHYVSAKLSGSDDGDVLRLVVAYHDSANYLFGELEFGTVSGVLRLFQMTSGSLYQLGQDASVADLAAGTTYEVTVCYDGVRLTIMLVGKAGYSQPVTATGTRVGVATGGIHASAYFGSVKWYAHYDAGGYYEEPNECPECRLRGQCTVCENNQTPQFLQVSITGTWIRLGCNGCLNLDGTYILPPVDQAYSHDPPDNGCDYELVLTGEDVNICDRANPTDPSASIYIKFRKAGSPLQIQIYGLIKIFSDLSITDSYEYLRDWGPADPFDPSYQLIPCLTLNNQAFQSSNRINLLCTGPSYNDVKVTSLD